MQSRVCLWCTETLLLKQCVRGKYNVMFLFLGKAARFTPETDIYQLDLKCIFVWSMSSLRDFFHCFSSLLYIHQLCTVLNICLHRPLIYWFKLTETSLFQFPQLFFKLTHMYPNSFTWKLYLYSLNDVATFSRTLVHALLCRKCWHWVSVSFEGD